MMLADEAANDDVVAADDDVEDAKLLNKPKLSFNAGVHVATNSARSTMRKLSRAVTVRGKVSL